MSGRRVPLVPPPGCCNPEAVDVRALSTSALNSLRRVVLWFPFSSFTGAVEGFCDISERDVELLGRLKVLQLLCQLATCPWLAMEEGAKEDFDNVPIEDRQPFMQMKHPQHDALVAVPRVETHLELVYEADGATRAGVRVWFDVIDANMDLDRYVDACFELYEQRRKAAKGRALPRPEPWDVVGALHSRRAWVALARCLGLAAADEGMAVARPLFTPAAADAAPPPGNPASLYFLCSPERVVDGVAAERRGAAARRRGEQPLLEAQSAAANYRRPLAPRRGNGGAGDNNNPPALPTPRRPLTWPRRDGVWRLPPLAVLPQLIARYYFPWVQPPDGLWWRRRGADERERVARILQGMAEREPREEAAERAETSFQRLARANAARLAAMVPPKGEDVTVQEMRHLWRQQPHTRAEFVQAWYDCGALPQYATIAAWLTRREDEEAARLDAEGRPGRFTLRARNVRMMDPSLSPFANFCARELYALERCYALKNTHEVAFADYVAALGAFRAHEGINTHVMLCGGSMLGKSYVRKLLQARLTIPGTVMSLTRATAHGWEGENNMDHLVLYADEAPPDWLGRDEKGRAAGTGDPKIKQLLTDGRLATMEPRRDPRTGRRETVTVVAQVRVVILANTNDSPAQQPAVRSRWIMRELEDRPRPGHDPDEQQCIDALEAPESVRSREQQMEDAHHRALHLAVAVAEQMIHTKLMENVNMEIPLAFFLFAKEYLAGLGFCVDAPRDTERFMNQARTLTLLHAAFLVFMTPAGGLPVGAPFEFDQVLRMQPYLYATEEIAFFAFGQLARQWVNPAERLAVQGAVAALAHYRGAATAAEDAHDEAEAHKQDVGRAAVVWRTRGAAGAEALDYNYLELGPVSRQFGESFEEAAARMLFAHRSADAAVSLENTLGVVRSLRERRVKCAGFTGARGRAGPEARRLVLELDETRRVVYVLRHFVDMFGRYGTVVQDVVHAFSHEHTVPRRVLTGETMVDPEAATPGLDQREVSLPQFFRVADVRPDPARRLTTLVHEGAVAYTADPDTLACTRFWQQCGYAPRDREWLVHASPQRLRELPREWDVAAQVEEARAAAERAERPLPAATAAQHLRDVQRWEEEEGGDGDWDARPVLMGAPGAPPLPRPENLGTYPEEWARAAVAMDLDNAHFRRHGRPRVEVRAAAAGGMPSAADVAAAEAAAAAENGRRDYQARLLGPRGADWLRVLGEQKPNPAVADFELRVRGRAVDRSAAGPFPTTANRVLREALGGGGEPAAAAAPRRRAMPFPAPAPAPAPAKRARAVAVAVAAAENPADEEDDLRLDARDFARAR